MLSLLFVVVVVVVGGGGAGVCMLLRPLDPKDKQLALERAPLPSFIPTTLVASTS